MKHKRWGARKSSGCKVFKVGRIVDRSRENSSSEWCLVGENKCFTSSWQQSVAPARGQLWKQQCPGYEGPAEFFFFFKQDVHTSWLMIFSAVLHIHFFSYPPFFSKRPAVFSRKTRNKMKSLATFSTPLINLVICVHVLLTKGACSKSCWLLLPKLHKFSKKHGLLLLYTLAKAVVLCHRVSEWVQIHGCRLKTVKSVQP